MTKRLSRWQVLTIALVSINLFLSSWYVLRGTIWFPSDVARDMFLLEEAYRKKIVLIGPRSSVTGLFHGPLWTYLNLPAYILGKGNPLSVGWWWIFLQGVFIAFTYFIAKSLFDRETALLSTLILSMYAVFHSNELFNPYGAYFLIPVFFLTVVKYTESLSLKMLIYHILALGFIIQFQMAVGIPLFILSLILVFYHIFKNKKWLHLAALPILGIPLSTFILFDLKHNFLMTQNMFRHLGTSSSTITVFDLIGDRVRLLFAGIEFLRFGPPNGQLIVAACFILFLGVQLRNSVHRRQYLLFLYYIVGFYTLSLTNRYYLLSFYVFPLYSLIFIVMSSFFSSRTRRMFLFFFFTVYTLNSIGAFLYVKNAETHIESSQFSWKPLYEMSASIYEEAGEDFGYFIYSPDILGYQPRYAMQYAGTVSHNTGFAFQKKPVTYLIFEPPAPDNPFTDREKWQQDDVHLIKEPVTIRSFPNGYIVERYELTQDEQQIPAKEGINPGLFYR